MARTWRDALSGSTSLPPSRAEAAAAEAEAVSEAAGEAVSEVDAEADSEVVAEADSVTEAVEVEAVAGSEEEEEAVSLRGARPPSRDSRARR